VNSNPSASTGIAAVKELCDMSQEQWYVGKLAGNGHLRYCSMSIKQWKKYVILPGPLPRLLIRI